MNATTSPSNIGHSLNTSSSGWPGVRQTKDERFSFSLNIGNHYYTEGGFYDAESAAQCMDATKYNFVQTGHLRRANFYFFPETVAKWQSDEEVNPKPHSTLLQFMRLNPPRHPTFSERQAAEEKKKTVKAEREIKASLPSPPKLFAMQQGVRKILAATPSRLSAEERAAFQAVLASITTFLA